MEHQCWLPQQIGLLPQVRDELLLRLQNFRVNKQVLCEAYTAHLKDKTDSWLCLCQGLAPAFVHSGF